VADRLAATGLLLVGGSSERFGSPKALARFRGESLAERSWRMLHEVCDEVIAVGKASGVLELPFAVLDDATSELAPVFGLLAGLRAARNETCLVLPVDCPLMTAESLRMLAREHAVPQTGPLPGAYERGMLPELERRVAAGELSLRGVNPTVVQLEESLLLNVNTRADLVAAAIADWARATAGVRAVVIVGSYARSETPADRWSDLDALLFVDDPDRYARDADWIAEFGEPVLTFLEPTFVEGRVEQRVLYEDGVDVDLPLLEASAVRELATARGVADLLARGYRVLHDEIGLRELLAEVAAPEPAQLPDAAALTQLASDFWHHALWSAKKLRRGEVFTAIECLDAYLKARVVALLRWHTLSLDPTVDTWHGGRFLERWADPGALAALERAYAHYDVRDVARALWETIDLFQGLEEETARRLGVTTGLDHADLCRRVGEVVPDPRRGSTLRP
jgi:aminoglycoside 6-adenylyltransferase